MRRRFLLRPRTIRPPGVHRVMEPLQRSLRGGVLIATVCLVMAIGIGIGGVLFGETSGDRVRGSDTTHSSVGALRSLFGSGGGDDDEPARSDPAPQPRVRSAVDLEPSVDVDVHRQPLPLSIAVPDLAPGMRATASVSFYYCTTGPEAAHDGDGGTFCGAMRNGQTVFPGAAACDVAYLGQRFRIEGDPTGRDYVCADTGSAVAGQHRDIWFYDATDGWSWAKETGRQVIIEILPAG